MKDLQWSKQGRSMSALAFSLLMMGFQMPAIAQLKGSVEYKPPRRGAPSRTIPAGTRFSEEMQEILEPSDPSRGPEIQSVPAPLPRDIQPSIFVPQMGEADACASQEGLIPLQALFPPPEQPEGNSGEVTIPTGLTMQGNPSLFIHLPPHTAPEAELVILEEQTREVVYYEVIMQPGSSGILRVPLPEVFEPGQSYVWEFALICNPENRNRDRYIQGNVVRIPTNARLARKLARTPDPLAQAQIYAQEGLWVDTLSVLGTVREQNPQEWTDLLNSVGLTDLAPIPFVEEPL